MEADDKDYRTARRKVRISHKLHLRCFSCPVRPLRAMASGAYLPACSITHHSGTIANSTSYVVTWNLSSLPSKHVTF